MVELLTIFALFVVCLLIYYQTTARTAKDVLSDLMQEDDAGKATLRLSAPDNGALASRRRGAASPSFSSASETRLSVLRARLMPWLLALILVVLNSLLSDPSPMGLIVTAVFGFSLGFILVGRLEKARQQNFQRQLEFYLPVIMERVVMAVQAGLDIIPAIKAVVDLEEQYEKDQVVSLSRLDPVTRLLKSVYQLTEAGMGFEQSLRQVAATVDCAALRHAFVHLAVAQKEGGELVMPLKELSDATQLYYQESIEEEIAKLPVKATLPLVCTFAGLIIFFITAPLLQVMTLTSQATL